VLTLHRCINYGTYWQVCHLVQALRSLGFDAVVIDHHSWRVNAVEWKCGFRPVLPTRAPPSDYLLYGWKMLKFFQAGATLPRSSRFALEEPARMEDFDLVVVGSDEVWNLQHPFYGGCPLFFGVGVKARRLISYAASFGNYSANSGLERIWAERLKNFDSISVRDANSQEIIRRSLGFNAPLVLDPCLQFADENCRPTGDGGFVAVYGHNFSQDFRRKVRRWADSRGYPLVSIGYRNAWVDSQWIAAGPNDFRRFMSRARAVATNFFHGCVFALMNGRPFVTEVSPYRSNKIQGLMTMLDGLNHLVNGHTPAAVYDDCLDGPLKPKLFERLEQLREASRTYLKETLS
jgi:Polysaccharide pyruvyl transferase